MLHVLRSRTDSLFWNKTTFLEHIAANKYLLNDQIDELNGVVLDFEKRTISLRRSLRRTRSSTLSVCPLVDLLKPNRRYSRIVWTLQPWENRLECSRYVPKIFVLWKERITFQLDAAVSPLTITIYLYTVVLFSSVYFYTRFHCREDMKLSYTVRASVSGRKQQQQKKTTKLKKQTGTKHFHAR